MEAFQLAVPFKELVLLSLVCFLLFVTPAVSAEKRAAYHSLNVAARLQEVRSQPVHLQHTNEQEENQNVPRHPWKLQILHRDALIVGNLTYQHRIIERLKRESRRVKALNRRMEKKLNKGKEMMNGKSKTEGFSGVVISGMAEGSGEYFTRIGVGTPAREQYFVLDTGSDVVWVQCQPCNDCYDQADPVFDPSSSASFTSISCGSPVCNELDVADCNSRGCVYQVAYGDGSYSIGSFATETLTFGTTAVQNVGIGCGHDNKGLFVGAGGLLGLGAGRLSFPTQLGTYGKVFSYCLVDRASGSSGTLEFGPASEPPAGSVFTQLLRNPQMDTFYYVSLTAISVGGLLVSLPQSVFEFDETGQGGVIVDSGTSVTRLQKEAYEAMRDAFVAGTTDLPRAPGIAIFDTCYDLSGHQTVSVPTVGFHFLNGVGLILPAGNYLIPMDSKGTFCLAFAPTSGDLSIIGNIQQQHFRVSIDSESSLVGFAPNQC
ncbi:hypothetical protein SUGI_0733700 [Cryptomeria japonica]|uniref:protein ASPARTIC PROTEASE IN GUARD CELL 2 n=1 Tax=Cryptomeria japonica TaxID=3369 RepID=UPI002414BD1E|nr:protein ASPARTIC PROTEASE IN GUARD CELL 2 [Cryptomeria japonica]GLJ36520.1 hypothetical protein SUGI_0733700 [Cryptomeria japonica]